MSIRRVVRFAAICRPTRNELRAQWLDVLNRIDGYCCAKDLTGYDHWRCGRTRGHSGDHRMLNYAWAKNRRAQYDPLESPDAQLHVPRASFSPTWLQRLRRCRGQIWKMAGRSLGVSS